LTGSRKGATTKYTQQSRTRTGITGGIWVSKTII
jgi:hypothetical protein